MSEAEQEANNKQNQEDQQQTTNGEYSIPSRKVRYTESGQIYLTPSQALIAIFKGQKNWCTSNFLRGLFMLKLLLGSFCGILVAAFKLDPYIYSFVFLLISIIVIYYIVVIRCGIDTKKVFHSRIKPYVDKLPHGYMTYFAGYMLYTFILQKIEAKHQNSDFL